MPFLTFLILTYRRPKQLLRLLDQFLDEKWNDIIGLSIEIIVADDHSEDDLRENIGEITKKLIDKGFRFRYIYRDTNLRGDLNLYQGYTQDSKGEYTWLYCDDDILVVEEAIKFIKEIYDKKPLVGLCGFSQGINKTTHIKLANDVNIENDIASCVDLLTSWPKTSTYVMKTLRQENFDSAFQVYKGTLFSWIGLCILMICENKNSNCKVLLYPNITAKGDEGYGELSAYSYRIFGKLYFVVEHALSLYGLDIKDFNKTSKRLQTKSEINLCLQGLYSNYSPKSEIKYSKEILEQELSFVKKNLLGIIKSSENIVILLKIIYVKYII